jgi:predicted nucleic acid-binding protein
MPDLPAWFLVDTNVLLRSAEPGHPMSAAASAAIDRLQNSGERACVVAQNLIEFRAVCTRPANVNGLEMTEAQADAEIAGLKRLFHVFTDEPRIFPEWERLVQAAGAAGKQNYDARIAAAMRVHGIAKILTFNRADFTRYPEIAVVTPQEVVQEIARS